jgi:AraC-like DNA-binding protein
LDGVEALIVSLLTADGLDIDVVAEAAGTSTRTLQRRLQSFGVSYSALVDRTRMRMASEWLAGGATPVAEIAAMLGYSDPAHFSRAFRRERGASPQQYRRQSR